MFRDDVRRFIKGDAGEQHDVQLAVLWGVNQPADVV